MTCVEITAPDESMTTGPERPPCVVPTPKEPYGPDPDFDPVLSRWYEAGA